MKGSSESSKTIKNAMEWVQKLGILFSNTKGESTFMHIQDNVVKGLIGNFGNIKPLCPTIVAFPVVTNKEHFEQL